LSSPPKKRGAARINGTPILKAKMTDPKNGLPKTLDPNLIRATIEKVIR
jgi:hypothetical protein